MSTLEREMMNGSIPVECIYHIVSGSHNSLVRPATTGECGFSRSAAILLVVIATTSFLINIRSLVSTRQNGKLGPGDRNLIYGMFISSLSVIIISLPSVVLQCLLCRRLCSPLICHIEGFNSFFNGCAAMYMLVALSIVRYVTTANSPLSIQFQQKLKEHNITLVFICFVLGSIWTVPPLFGRMSAYSPEGLGFHCGIDWFDRTTLSRVYFFLLFFGVYFIPLSIVIYVNIYIKKTVYRLTHLNPTVSIEMEDILIEDPIRKHISSSSREKEMQRLRRLYEDRRFVVATGRSVVIYTIAWTPYSLVALAQVFGDYHSMNNPWVMTTCALMAKLAMVANPIIYTFILKNQDLVIVPPDAELLR